VVLADQEVHIRRSSRTIQKPSHLSDYEVIHDVDITTEGNLVHFALIAESEPVSFVEAAAINNWWDVVKEEITSTEKNQTWELVDLLYGKKPIDLKWVYKVKVNPKGEIMRYKARLVVKGFLQKPWVDYGEIFSQVAKIETVRIIVSLAVFF